MKPIFPFWFNDNSALLYVFQKGSSGLSQLVTEVWAGTVSLFLCFIIQMFKSLQHIWSEKVMYKLKIIIKNIRPLSSLGSQQNSWSFLSSVCVSQTTAGRSTTIRQSLEYKHFSKLRSQFENMHSVWTIAALEFFPDYISAEQSESVKRRSPSAKLDSALLSIWTINSSRPRCLWKKRLIGLSDLELPGTEGRSVSDGCKIMSAIWQHNTRPWKVNSFLYKS